MKRDQVPQDDADLMEGHREVVYAVDDKGNYVKALSPGWEPKNTALLQAWEQIDEKAREACRLFEQGKASPLAFFMAVNIFDLKLLSDYTGIPKRKIKAHLDPENFKKLDGETLRAYSEAFNITPAELAAWRPDLDSLSRLQCKSCHSEHFDDSQCKLREGSIFSKEKRDSSAPLQNDIVETGSKDESKSTEVKK